MSLGGTGLFLAKVVTPVVCTIKHPSLVAQKLLLVERVDPDGAEVGEYHLAVDYVGAGPGAVVLAGGPPGLGESLGLTRAPISTWVMAIVEQVGVAG